MEFYEKAQFPHSFGRIVRNYEETVPFRGRITLKPDEKFYHRIYDHSIDDKSSCQK